MEIKIDETTLIEFPDDLAALLIADPSYGDTAPEFGAQEVNILIHGLLASLYDVNRPLEQNIANIREQYGSIVQPVEVAIQTAIRSIHRYNAEISEEDIGLVNADDMLQFNQDSLLTLGRNSHE